MIAAKTGSRLYFKHLLSQRNSDLKKTIVHLNLTQRSGAPGPNGIVLKFSFIEARYNIENQTTYGLSISRSNSFLKKSNVTLSLIPNLTEEEFL